MNDTIAPVDVVCGIIRDARGSYLVCLRANGRVLAGHWEFPGGKVERGELPEQALARELREELAVEIHVGDPLSPVEWCAGEGSIRLLPFFCTIREGTPVAIEHQAIEWCTPSRLRPRLWAPADLPILNELVPAPIDLQGETLD